MGIVSYYISYWQSAFFFSFYADCRNIEVDTEPVFMYHWYTSVKVCWCALSFSSLRFALIRCPILCSSDIVYLLIQYNIVHKHGHWKLSNFLTYCKQLLVFKFLLRLIVVTIHSIDVNLVLALDHFWFFLWLYEIKNKVMTSFFFLLTVVSVPL